MNDAIQILTKRKKILTELAQVYKNAVGEEQVRVFNDITQRLSEVESALKLITSEENIGSKSKLLISFLQYLDENGRSALMTHEGLAKAYLSKTASGNLPDKEFICCGDCNDWSSCEAESKCAFYVDDKKLV